MLTILCAAILATPQEASLDRVPFQPAAAAPTLHAAPATDGAFLGVAIGGGEARISSVVTRSAAEVAGLMAGDVIVSIAGVQIAAGSDVSSAIANHSAGETVSIVVRRGDDELVRDVVLGRRMDAAATPSTRTESQPVPHAIIVPSAPPPPVPMAPTAPSRLAPARPMAGPGFLGVMAEPAERGLSIASVNPGGPAEHAGLLQGDVIIEVSGDRVASVDELVEHLARAGAGHKIDLKIERDGSELDTVVVLGARPGSANEAQSGGAHGSMQIESPHGEPQFFSFDGNSGVFQIEGLDVDDLDGVGLESEGQGGGSLFYFERDGAGRAHGDAAPRQSLDAADMGDMQREFRQRFNEMNERHRAEMEELQSEMREMFEAHGMRPLIEQRIERRNAQGGGQAGGQAAPLLRGFLSQGDASMAPQPGQARPLQSEQQTVPGALRLFRSGAGTPNSQGEQRIIELEVRPDGSRIERSRRAELKDGQWRWVEENVDELPPQAPPLAPSAGGGALRAMPASPHAAAPARDPAMEAAIADLRRQIDELEKRAAELLERGGQ